jgi:ribonuclease HI
MHKVKVATDRELVDVKWQPPPSNMIKMNAKEGHVGLGLIARDSYGKFLATLSMSLAVQTESTSAEALATVNAITFCKELGFDNIVF